MNETLEGKTISDLVGDIQYADHRIKCCRDERQDFVDELLKRMGHLGPGCGQQRILVPKGGLVGSVMVTRVMGDDVRIESVKVVDSDWLRR